MTLRKLFPAFSCFFLLFVLLGISGCFGDDVTLKDCGNNITVNVTEGEECPAPPPPPPPPPTTPPPTTPPETPEPGADSGKCNLFAEGKAPFNGSSTADVICGDEDNNTINALGGEDVVRAGGGNDIVDGGQHDDEIYGEAGDDTLDGDRGEDILDGGAGNDVLTGGEDDDKLIGGAGSDTVKYIGTQNEAVDAAGIPTGTGVSLNINLADGYSEDEYEDQDEYIGIENVEIVGIAGTAYTITGDGNANRLTGGAGDDTINGGGGNDVIDGMGGTNTLDGQEGTDTLVVGASTTLDSGNSGFENLQARAGAGALNLTGNSENNVLTGNEGVNNLLGGLGRNTLTGGDGTDCFEITVDDSPDVVTDFATGEVINVTGTLPTATETGGSVAPTAQNGSIAAIETYTPDGQTDPRTKNLGTLATVRGLKATDTTAVASGSC